MAAPQGGYREFPDFPHLSHYSHGNLFIDSFTHKTGAELSSQDTGRDRVAARLTRLRPPSPPVVVAQQACHPEGLSDPNEHRPGVGRIPVVHHVEVCRSNGA